MISPAVLELVRHVHARRGNIEWSSENTRARAADGEGPAPRDRWDGASILTIYITRWSGHGAAPPDSLYTRKTNITYKITQQQKC